MTPERLPRIHLRPALVLMAALLSLVSFGAGAQQSRMRDLLPAEFQPAAWKAQARTIARDLALDQTNRARLEEAYVKARERNRELRDKRMAESFSSRTELMRVVNEIRDRERKRFKESVASFLDDAQARRVDETLGRFEAIWDAFAYQAAQLDLNDEQRARVEPMILEAALKMGAARERVIQSGEFSRMAAELLPIKQQLDTRLKPVMPPAAHAAWLEKTTPPQDKKKNKDAKDSEE